MDFGQEDAEGLRKLWRIRGKRRSEGGVCETPKRRGRVQRGRVG